MKVKIIPVDNPPGKLAEAEIHFEDGYFQGLKLVGFAIWERRSGNGRNVTFPARQYSVNGERRSFALLRPITDSTAQDRVRDLILQAYAEHEERCALANGSETIQNFNADKLIPSPGQETKTEPITTTDKDF